MFFRRFQIKTMGLISNKLSKEFITDGFKIEVIPLTTFDSQKEYSKTQKLDL
jgi:hypothetical protein